jgi:hypothetical protein
MKSRQIICENLIQNNNIKTNKPLPFMTELDFRLYKIKRPSPIQTVEFKTYFPDKHGQLLFTLRTPLEYPLISNAINHSNFKWTKEYYSSEYHGSILWKFNLNKHNKIDIGILFNDIFNQLILLMTGPTIKDRLFFIQNELNSSLKKFFRDEKAILLKPRFYIEFEDGIPNSYGAKKLFEAITQHNVDKVYELLSHCVDPNSYYERFSALNFAIDAGAIIYPSERSVLLKRLSIIALLLEYGANPMLETYGLTTFERTVNESIFESIFRFSKISVEYFDEIMKLLTATDAFRPHICITEEVKKTKLGKIVHGTNMFFKELSEKSHQYSKILNVIYQDNSFNFYLSGYVKISVKSLSGVDLNQDEIIQEELYQLFKSTFGWEKISNNFDNDENKFRAYFKNLLPNSTGIVDCIRINNVLVGMNIADINIKEYDGKKIMLHYIKLAAANEILRNYKRFMSIISFARGFALQKNNPDIPVITYFEAASVNSYLQVCPLDMFPKIKTLEMIMKKIAENLYSSQVDETKGLHITDKLAVTKKSSLPNKFFWTENELAIKGFEKRYQIDKQSLLVGFINNEVNLKKLAGKINPHCSGIQFKEMVDYYSEINNPSIPSLRAKL